VANNPSLAITTTKDGVWLASLGVSEESFKGGNSQNHDALVRVHTIFALSNSVDSLGVLLSGIRCREYFSMEANMSKARLIRTIRVGFSSLLELAQLRRIIHR
jgi:hypothetical protein